MEIKPEQDILIEYSGWCMVAPYKVKFQYISGDENAQQIITGKEWLKLPDSADARYSSRIATKCDYVLENAIDAMRDSGDGEWDTLEVSESNGTRYWQIEGYLK